MSFLISLQVRFLCGFCKILNVIFIKYQVCVFKSIHLVFKTFPYDHVMMHILKEQKISLFILLFIRFKKILFT